MEVHDPGRVLAAAPALIITERTTGAEVSASYCGFGRLDDYEIGGRRFRGRTPWERHPLRDELLFVSDGEAELTLLFPDREERIVLRKGALCVVSRGTWHRFDAAGVASIWGVTHGADDEMSEADDPRL